MSKIKEYYLARTFKSESGERRVTYRPDKCVVQPWIASYKDSHTVHFRTLESAIWYHQHIDDPLIINEEKYAS